MSDPIMKKIEQFAKRYCVDEILKSGKTDSTLWKDHVRLVRKYALLLADIEGADRFVVETAALLHDTGKYKGGEGHAERSYELSTAFLKGLNIPKHQSELILKCIIKHGSEHAKEDNEIEVKIIQSADALGTLFDDEWQNKSAKSMDKETLMHLVEKTFNKINLESARKIGKPRYEELIKKYIKF